ncbi:DEKNAAC102135 [Brettanomyces naardenensis]|uniref:DEKNAAC102135 n=1 Tax=Brettanomyces naardenensis TaxID=13370 RepID=A0A448YJW5_BRENA|nr:DEKNAAC102135 [Brettanomyces naardenensis]
MTDHTDHTEECDAPPMARKTGSFQLSTSDESHSLDPPHTILTNTERGYLAGLVSLMTLCSALNTPIYWVALPEMQTEFHITEQQSNLTVTVYLVFQAISPLFFCTLADYIGRRPVVLYCLLGCAAFNIGLAVCKSYGVMLFLRSLLAVHGSPFAAISSAIVGDFTTRKDRGGLIGMTMGFTLIGIGIAPFIGACLDSRWRWRGIFWFSAAFNGLVLLLAAIFYPETRRTIVGNLGIAPKSWIHKSPVIYMLGIGRVSAQENGSREEKQQMSFNPITTLALMRDPLVLFALFPNSIVYSGWTSSQATLTTALTLEYHYSPMKVGLCYFASGVACFLSTFTFGKLLNVAYRKAKEKQTEGRAVGTADPTGALATTATPLPPLNIIRVRMSYFQATNVVVIATITIFGWAIYRKWNIAVILVVSFLLTFCGMYPQMASSTLLVDMYPERSGAISSLNNLTRCGLASIFVSCLTLMNNAMTVGGTYSFMAGLCLLCGISVPFIFSYSDKILNRRQDEPVEGI